MEYVFTKCEVIHLRNMIRSVAELHVNLDSDPATHAVIDSEQADLLATAQEIINNKLKR